MNDDRHEGNAPGFGGPADSTDFDAAIDQLVAELAKAESTRAFVGLKWFRDHVLPQCDYDWSQDSGARHLLLRHATDRQLVLTSHVPNPNQPHHPVSAIRVNRRHPRFQTDDAGHANDLTPVRIRGGLISETILGDRH